MNDSLKEILNSIPRYRLDNNHILLIPSIGTELLWCKWSDVKEIIKQLYEREINARSNT